jgi:uncharacterized protein YcaQ
MPPPRRPIVHVNKPGSLTIQDIEDEVLVEKELSERHFGWERRPAPASEKQVSEYLLDRALRAQAIVSLDSVCHLDARRKPAIREIIETRVRRRQLVAVAIEGAEPTEHFTTPDTLDAVPEETGGLVHILSPFDPLIIQRKRLKLFFDYEHRFEAYVPKEKRVLGYFALPVLLGDEVVAAIDLKANRENGKLLVQRWTWVGRGSARAHKARVEQELHRFEQFQIGG